MNGGETSCPNLGDMQCMNNLIPFSLWNRLFTIYLIKIIDSPEIDDTLHSLLFSSFGFGTDLVVYNINNSYIQMSQSNINCLNGWCTYKNKDNSNEYKFYIYEPMNGIKQTEKAVGVMHIIHKIESFIF